MCKGCPMAHNGCVREVVVREPTSTDILATELGGTPLPHRLHHPQL